MKYYEMIHSQNSNHIYFNSVHIKMMDLKTRGQGGKIGLEKIGYYLSIIYFCP